MAKTLGIFVSSDKHLGYVVGLTGAAHAQGIDVQIFFSGKGVLLTRSPELANLVGRRCRIFIIGSPLYAWAFVSKGNHQVGLL